MAGAGSLVSNARAFSVASSLHLTGSTDLVHEHPIVTGSWSYAAQQRIDSGAGGVSCFIAMRARAVAGNSARHIAALDLCAGSGSSLDDTVSLAQLPAPSAASLLFLGAAVAAGRSRTERALSRAGRSGSAAG